jgi:hypothetical protein
LSITLEFMGLLKTFAPASADDRGELVIDGQEGRFLEAVSREIGVPLDLVAYFIVNGKAESGRYTLCDGDHIRMVALIGGG